ncbi:hypothetical protein FOL47_001833 [Perkinsus chesapeaki]|uniref:Zinc finger ZPR1-type domain-containing protein n=1 Tax=Perkinsus chesapeaki TaxID=330153 RepID=A0A7J6MH04_PERCH|nr:hypothetical protein FOL47_001833 [Perkinsus chesapeaki]
MSDSASENPQVANATKSEGGAPKHNELDAFRIDVSHQEMSMIMLEMEKFCATCPEDTWISLDDGMQWLCTNLGYEDKDEFEDAIKGSFKDFLAKLPQFEMKEQDGKWYFKPIALKEDLDKSTWGRPMKMTLHITDRKQLWTVFLKSSHAHVEIPEIEFEIGADMTRQVDTIYNFIGAAVLNLGDYIKANQKTMSEDQLEKMCDAVSELNKLLDVDEPFTWIVHDPSGRSCFKPDDDVKVEYLDLDTITEENEEEEHQTAADHAAADATEH